MKQLAIVVLILVTAYCLDAQSWHTKYGDYTGVNGNYSTFIGDFAGQKALTSSYGNTFLGMNSGRYISSGKHNTFTGVNAGLYISTGAHNTFYGASSGLSNNTGSFNSFLGTSAGNKNTSGSKNVFVGNTAGRTNSTGKENTFVGMSSGFENTTGSFNTYIGRQSGGGNKAGSNNVALGYLAGFKGGGNGNIFIGKGAGYNEVGHNKLYIDNSGTANPLIYGDFATNELALNGKVRVGSRALPAGFQMSVDGKIITTEVRVQVSNSWDEVFTKDYDLMSIEEKEAFTKKNHHLPSIEPEAKVVAEGMEIGKSHTDLLKEVEEAHMYIFKLNDMIKELQKQVNELKKQ